MNLASNKAKQYGITALKVLILSLCFIFIYNKIQATKTEIFITLADKLRSASLLLMIGIPLFAVLNWLLEIRKWQLLASTVSSITFGTAAKQSLAAFSAAIWTPNRIGEYGAKALYFESDSRTRIMLMKLFGNSAQLMATLFFGIPGLAYIVSRYGMNFSTERIGLLLCVILLLLILGYRYRRSELIVSGLSISNVLKHLKQLPGTLKGQVLAISALRYLVFGGMFLGLLLYFQAGPEVLPLIGFLSSVYLISSVIPGFVLFDVAVKGGVAMWLTDIVGLDPTAVLAAILLMWILNFVIPAIFGSYFVIIYKPVVR